ncbi:NAD(P)-dependent oxidoreductase [Pseudothauera nasutitermitis]|uniref:NAD(P)-dependent oxidoreductase n=1 Tax=Pseudothauera nasutitermitis TaxID=2565930 RepID=A0A4S4AN57_9RHOO|nr:NAD(P)-dependent oxidoreductase [Pseudothauera nasutitermitis]THF61064.1 NAD(P)-dependent oxidoreductase [Pseudothauera nasutitermitis]
MSAQPAAHATHAANAPRVGWIGLGKMGTPMAANLLAAGFALRVYNRSPARAAALLEKGATLAPSVPLLAQECDVVISMVSDDPALQDVALNEGGLFAAAAPGLVFIDMSTVSPALSARVAEAARQRGIDYLRAPVSGSTATAAAGALTILASGPQDAYDRCTPLLQAMGSKLHYLGPAEQARYLKVAINMMVGVTAAMLGEALVLGERGGVDWQQMIEVINSSVVASPLLGYKTAMLATRDFAPMFTAAQMAKDFDLALDAGRNANVPMPLAAVSRQFLGAMIASGRGEMDFFAYVTLLEELAGIGDAGDRA